MKTRLLSFFLVMLSMLGTSNMRGNNIPERPEPATFMNDIAGVLTPEEVASLEQQLRAYSDSTLSQIVIVILSDLDGADVATTAFEIGNKWGVGRKDRDSGILILLSMGQGEGDRDLFIATGYGHEDDLPDATCKQIIEDTMIPFLKEEKWFEGLQAGLQEINRNILMTPEERAEVKRLREEATTRMAVWLIVILAIVVVVAILFIVWVSNQSGGGGSYGGYSGGYSSGSSGGYSGGGGFGGGSFGGGGAGGRF